MIDYDDKFNIYIFIDSECFSDGERADVILRIYVRHTLLFPAVFLCVLKGQFTPKYFEKNIFFFF